MTVATTTASYEIGNLKGFPPGAFTIPAPGNGLYHLLISGETGSGKSSTTAKLLKGFCADPRVALFGVDFKEGLELEPWAPRFTDIAINHETAGPLLRWLVEQIPARAAVIRQAIKDEGRTIREWRDDMGYRIVVVADELSMVDKAELEDLKNLAARGRALVISLICCTQYALAKRFDTDFLNNLGGRICHRMAGPTQYATALRVTERDLVDAGWEPISEETPGICYITGIPGIADLTRGWPAYVSDPVIDDWVKRTARLRVTP